MRATRRSRRTGAVADGHADLQRPFHSAMAAAPAPFLALGEADDPWSLHEDETDHPERPRSTEKAEAPRAPKPKPAKRRGGPRRETLGRLDPRLWPDAKPE